MTNTIALDKTAVPLGATVSANGVDFRLWAPRCKHITLVIESLAPHEIEMTPQANGYFTGHVDGVGGGTLYRFRLDNHDKPLPDPASYFQPQGPHGPSQVVDHSTFKWTDHSWPGITAAGQVLYEFHCGTFTPQGTWAAAIEKLPLLKDVGITCIEVMPVAEFPGKFGWGYDGVSLFATYHGYGQVDDFKRFIDRAHALGIGVILDLVYNHLGPDGNYITEFSDTFFNSRKHTDWGDAINFDAEGSQPTRDFYVANACYWIEKFHLDGFRFDATQAIVDTSPRHILLDITEAARAVAGARGLYIINENGPQETHLVRPPSQGGYGMDALWNDDFHHAARVALSGHNEGYFQDHCGTPQEFISAAKYGYIYQGQGYTWHRQRRGTPSMDLPPTAFVNFMQNHDQIANSGTGRRAHQIGHPGAYRALTALLLLGPQTPMLFQGQEFAATSPFYYFADHHTELGKLICTGRAKELSQFPALATPEFLASIPQPCSAESFEKSKLNWGERETGIHAEALRLHTDLLRVRRDDALLSRVARRGDIDGAVLSDRAFVLRFFGSNFDDRLLLINLGGDLALRPAPEPLLAPPGGMRWNMMLSTEEPKYGGAGAAAVDTEEEGWFLPGYSATLVGPKPAAEAEVKTRVVQAGTAQTSFDKTDEPNE